MHDHDQQVVNKRNPQGIGKFASKSNGFIRALYGISDEGHMFLLSVMSLIDSKAEIKELYFSFDKKGLSDFIKTNNIIKSVSNKKIEKLVMELFDLKVCLETQGSDEYHYTDYIHVFKRLQNRKSKIHGGEETTFMFDEEFLPAISNLTSAFTQLEMSVCQKLRKFPVIQLYGELLRDLRIKRANEAETIIRFEDCVSLMNAPKAIKFYQFKIRYLDRIVEAINKEDSANLTIEYEAQKREGGNRYTHIRFVTRYTRIPNRATDTKVIKQPPSPSIKVPNQVEESTEVEIENPQSPPSSPTSQVKSYGDEMDELIMEIMPTLSAAKLKIIRMTYNEQILAEAISGYFEQLVIKEQNGESISNPYNYFTGIAQRLKRQGTAASAHPEEKTLAERLNDHSWADGL